MSCKYPKESRMHYACVLCSDKNICKDTIITLPQTNCNIPMPEVTPVKYNGLRRCNGQYYKDGLFHNFKMGYFHQWGCNYEEFESGAGNYSVAIVELPNGEIVTPVPTDIEFIDNIGE